MAETSTGLTPACSMPRAAASGADSVVGLRLRGRLECVLREYLPYYNR
jgi:hypothetical protein